METPSPTAFYKNASEVMPYNLDDSLPSENEKNTHVGTIQRLCNSLKRPFQNSLNSSRRYLLRSSGDHEHAQEKVTVLFTATAIRDSNPHPYDSNGLAFKCGDKIEVVHISDYGVWTGRCGGKIGNFKFVDVEKDDIRVRRISKSYPELQNLCQRSKSVSDLLSSINLETLIPKFVLNGFDTTESVRNMTDDDLEYLGIVDDNTKDLIMGTVDWLNMCDNERENSINDRIPDSGFNSSSDSMVSAGHHHDLHQNHHEDHHKHHILVTTSYLHPAKTLSQSVNDLLAITPL